MSQPPAADPALDPETLHELPPDANISRSRAAELREQIRTAQDDTAELLARGDLVELLRINRELDEALTEAERAANRAEMAGTAAQQHLARVRLAHVRQWRGEFAESNLIFTELLNASTQFGPVVEAFTLERAGKNDYDQGHFDDACAHFRRALEIREKLELADEIEASRLALHAATRRRQGGEP
jgi:tetratricopeptide (TPR) repeat protein